MNLAIKDIRHGLFRFVLTCFGLGLLMTVVLAMIGIYNGLVADALAVVKAPAADVWVVEAGTQGPFAEASSIPADTRDAVAHMPGVAEAGAMPARTRSLTVAAIVANVSGLLTLVSGGRALFGGADMGAVVLLVCRFSRRTDPGFPSRTDLSIDYVPWVRLGSRHV